MKEKIRRKTRVESEEERTRLTIFLRGIPSDAIALIECAALKKHLRLTLALSTIWTVKSQVIKGRGEEMAGKKEENKAEKIGAAIVVERVASIAAKTYAHLGDGEKVASEDALRMIVRELKTYDPSILIRNEKRALPKQAPLVNPSTRS